MSHIRPLRPPQRTAWRFFPWFLAGGIGSAALVNFAMTYLAFATFPGQVTNHGFANSNAYNAVLAAAERQAALGWSVRTDLDGARPVVTLANSDGAPLVDAHVAAAVHRPVGDPDRQPLALRQTAPDRFSSDTDLAPGRWDLELTVTSTGHEYRATRRLVVER
jgi:nitrogen fixation protein FixH